MASICEQDLVCPICLNVFKEPVLLVCSHSFCRSCVKTYWTKKNLLECAVCKKRSPTGDPPLNLALKNLCDSIVKSSNEPLCKEHLEKFKLYCLNDQLPICLVCRDSKTHTDHKFRPINEVLPELRDKMEKSLGPLLDHQKNLNTSNKKFSAAAAHIEAQARLTERQIQDQFKRLHQFLEEEEQARIRAVREEEEHKKKNMKDKMEAVSREIEALSETITATKKHLKATDVCFLLQYKTTVGRVQHCPLVEEHQLGSGALIDPAKHLGNLGFNIWNKMKVLFEFYPVILDPNTAHSHLILSNDLNSVTRGEKLQLPDNANRFDCYDCVLGSEGFTSGTHSWDVEVSGDKHWSVGVMSESVQRKGYVTDGVWEIYFLDGKYGTISRPGPDEPLSLKKTLQRVRVKLDVDRGTLCFSDADTNTHLHTFTHTFTERLFPCFQTINKAPLRILPGRVCVALE